MLNSIDDMPKIVGGEINRWYYEECLLSGGDDKSQARVFYGYDKEISPHNFYRVEIRCDFTSVVDLPTLYHERLPVEIQESLSEAGLAEHPSLYAANDNRQLDLFDDYQG